MIMDVFMMREKKFMTFLLLKHSFLLKVKHNQIFMKLMRVMKKVTIDNDSGMLFIFYVSYLMLLSLMLLKFYVSQLWTMVCFLLRINECVYLLDDLYCLDINVDNIYLIY